MALRIPFNPEKNADQSFKVDLGGSVVSIRMLWNTRDQAWYMDVVSTYDTARSIKVVKNSPLVSGRVDFGVDGDFFVLKTDSQAPDLIGYFDLGKNWNLFWFSQGEIDGL